MIDVSNLKDALKTLGFVAYGDIYEKVFFEIGCSLKVDFQAKRLIYPNEIKGRERNNGFDKKENFVVFECVCRLLSKGYRPEHIELEKEWHLGHDPKGGRADICVTDTSGNMLFIIECKTDFCGKQGYVREYHISYLSRWLAASDFPGGRRCTGTSL